MPAATAFMPSDERLRQHGGGGGAVAGVVGGLGSDFLHHLRAHVLERVSQFDFLGDGDAVLGDGRRAVALLQHDVAALRAEGRLHGVGEHVEALLQIVGGDKLIIPLLMELHMNPFKGRHFQRDIILWAVRWYCKYGISYRELQEMLAERGVNVDHSTIYRWVQRYAPEMEKRLRWYWRNPSDLCPWHMDETYVKVNGRWAYLYRAVDSRGRTVDFYLSSRRNSKAAYRFLGKILNNVKKWQIPRFINTDKAPAYGRALALLKREGRCPSDVEHRQIKYRNNVIECDHGKLKRIIGATLGFKSMKTAYATIKGIEVMRALRKGQASAFYYGDPLGEMRLVSRVFEM